MVGVGYDTPSRYQASAGKPVNCYYHRVRAARQMETKQKDDDGARTRNLLVLRTQGGQQPRWETAIQMRAQGQVENKVQSA